MTERLWKVLNCDRTNAVADTKFVYPADGTWTEHLAPSSLRLCERGYHYAEGRQVLDWLPNADTALLCEIERCPKHKPKRGDNKSATCSLCVVRSWRLSARVLRRFACDCAERALVRERAAGREPDKRSWDAVRVARAFAYGKATRQELDAAGVAARAAGAAAWAAAWDAARAAAGVAARAARAAGAAAWDAEKEWQYHRLLQIVGAEEKS